MTPTEKTITDQGWELEHQGSFCRAESWRATQGGFTTPWLESEEAVAAYLRSLKKPKQTNEKT